MAQQTFSGVPGDFTAGQVLTAADMDKLREFLLYLIKDGDEGDTGEVSPLIMDLGNDLVRVNDRPTPGVYYDSAHVSGSTTITNNGTLPVDTALDVTVAAATADVITYTFTHYIAAGTNFCHFAPCTIDAGGTTINNMVPVGALFNPWFCPTTMVGARTWTAVYEVAAGDIVSDEVTVRLKADTANVARQVASNNVGGLYNTLVNLGPKI